MKRLYLLGILLLAPHFGCVTIGRYRVLKSRVDTLERRMDLVQKKFYAETGKIQHLLGERIQSLKNLSDLIGKRNANLGSNMSSLTADFNKLRGEFEVTMHKFGTILRDLNGVKDFIDDRFGKSLTKLPTGTPKDKDAMFSFGVRMLRGGKTRETRAVFRHFIDQYPKDELADKAQFYIGESYWVEKKWAQAIRAYATMESTYKNSKILGRAIYRLGEALLKWNRCKKAQKIFKYLSTSYRRKFPKDAARAKVMAKKLRKTCK